MDNLRWVIILLVLFYHVFYFYNNKGVFGGIGGFSDGPQYQDVVMYILYPWFMPMLFLLAGISSRFALNKRTGKQWLKSRTIKLLVPSTIGLFVFQWMTGYFSTVTSSYFSGTPAFPEGTPSLVKYFIWSLVGIGPLWFVQVLWVLGLVLLLLRKCDPKDKVWQWCGKAGLLLILLLGNLFWLGELTLVKNPRPGTIDGLLNLYKPVFYLVPFLLGYYFFSHDEVLEKIRKAWIPLMCCAVLSGILLTVTTFGQDNTSPEYLRSPLNCLYGWLMCLAMMGWFQTKFDYTGKFSQYMTRSSYGIYIVHYLVISCFGYMMKVYTGLAPWEMYVILTLAVFVLSPLLYEGLRRIPVVKWCVFGE